MHNELIFILYCIATAGAATVALRAGVAGLTTYIALNSVLMNLLVTKQITLVGWTATPTDALGIGTALGLNLLREYFTQADAYRALRISFAAMGWYVIVSWFQLWYAPAPDDICAAHFQVLLSPMPRILLASMLAYIVTETLEIRLYGLAQRLTHRRWFMLRNIVVTGSTQLIDTILFTVLAFMGTGAMLGEIVIVSYSIKLATIITMVPAMSLFRRLRHVFSF